MHVHIRKVISIVVCMSFLTSTGISFLPAYAAETEAAQTRSEEYGTFKKFTPSIHTEEIEKVSTVPKGNAYIPKDTVIEVELSSEISSKTSHKGDTVPLVMTQNVIINDVIVIPAGTKVEAKIIKARKNGMFGRSGKLEFSIDGVKTINNIHVPLSYIGEKKAGNDGGAVAVAAAVTIIGGMFMKGKNVTFPAGTQFEANVDSDTDLHVKLTDLKDAMDTTKPHGVAITLQ